MFSYVRDNSWTVSTKLLTTVKHAGEARHQIFPSWDGWRSKREFTGDSIMK